MSYRHRDIESAVRDMLHQRVETLRPSRLAPPRVLRRARLRWLGMTFVVTSIALLAAAGSVYAARSLVNERSVPPAGPTPPPDCRVPEEAAGRFEWTSRLLLLASGDHRGEVWSICGATARDAGSEGQGLCLDVRVTGARGPGMTCSWDELHRGSFEPGVWDEVGLAWGIAPEATSSVRIRTRHLEWVEAQIVDLTPLLDVSVKLYVGTTNPNDFARLEVLDAEGNVIVTDDPPAVGTPTPEPPDEPSFDPIGPVEELDSGKFAGEPWSITVFESESGLCLDFDGIDDGSATGAICTALEPWAPLADDHIGAMVSRSDDDGSRIVIGTVLKEVATLTVELDDGSEIPVEILEPERVDTPWNYYAAELPPGAKGRRVARDVSGAVLETEPLSGNEDS